MEIDKQFECICGKKFALFDNLARHRKFYNDHNLPSVKTIHKCMFCKTGYNSARELSEHARNTDICPGRNSDKICLNVSKGNVHQNAVKLGEDIKQSEDNNNVNETSVEKNLQDSKLQTSTEQVNDEKERRENPQGSSKIEEESVKDHKNSQKESMKDDRDSEEHVNELKLTEGSEKSVRNYSYSALMEEEQRLLQLEEDNFQCEVCGKAFFHLSHLQSHVKADHFDRSMNSTKRKRQVP